MCPHGGVGEGKQAGVKKGDSIEQQPKRGEPESETISTAANLMLHNELVFRTMKAAPDLKWFCELCEDPTLGGDFDGFGLISSNGIALKLGGFLELWAKWSDGRL